MASKMAAPDPWPHGCRWHRAAYKGGKGVADDFGQMSKAADARRAATRIEKGQAEPGKEDRKHGGKVKKKG